VDLETYPFPSDPLSADSLRFADVSVPAPIGSFPAWRTDGPRSDWIVMVHGLAAGRGASLNTLGALASFGFPTLSISYRNDPNAPRSPDGHYHLGATEWQDLEAAVAYARAHGARRVVLYGLSMGGAIVANFLRESPHRADVAAVILGVPALAWDADIPASDFTTPGLLFHGTRDPTIPIASSANLARAIPSQVTFVSTEGAGHVQSWNYDPAGYEDKLRTWLEGTLGPARDTTGSRHL
jgi:alpha-beta hydrolase superfamily lysophospholipase